MASPRSPRTRPPTPAARPAAAGSSAERGTAVCSLSQLSRVTPPRLSSGFQRREAPRARSAAARRRFNADSRCLTPTAAAAGVAPHLRAARRARGSAWRRRGVGPERRTQPRRAPARVRRRRRRGAQHELDAPGERRVHGAPLGAAASASRTTKNKTIFGTPTSAYAGAAPPRAGRPGTAPHDVTAQAQSAHKTVRGLDRPVHRTFAKERWVRAQGQAPFVLINELREQ